MMDESFVSNLIISTFENISKSETFDSLDKSIEILLIEEFFVCCAQLKKNGIIAIVNIMILFFFIYF